METSIEETPLKETPLEEALIMEACGHEELYITFPPTLEFLTENFPLITLDETIDRSIPRCKLCDLIAANAREEAATYPRPTFTKPIPGIRRHMKMTEQLITQDVRQEEPEASLPLMEQISKDEIKARNQRTIEAWMRHWAIWGPGEGPEPENEYVAEEQPDLETEIVAKEKPKAVLKIRGWVSGRKLTKGKS